MLDKSRATFSPTANKTRVLKGCRIQNDRGFYRFEELKYNEQQPDTLDLKGLQASRIALNLVLELLESINDGSKNSQAIAKGRPVTERRCACHVVVLVQCGLFRDSFLICCFRFHLHNTSSMVIFFCK